MPYGKLVGRQEEAVRAFVDGKIVADLGAGDMSLSKKLLDLGATKVIAVDKEHFPAPDPRITSITAYFGDVWQHTRPPRAAFLSWPINREEPALVDLIRRIPFIAYLGKNTDYTSCASPRFFHAMLRREVMAYLPAPKNVLILYGPNAAEREPYGEELAAITSAEKVWMYEEAEAAAETLRRGR